MAPNYLRRARRRDRIATVVIKAGGMAVIASVILILVLIVKEAMPLFLPASVVSTVSFPMAEAKDAPVMAIGLDEYLATAYTIAQSGAVTFYDATTGDPTSHESVAKPEGADSIRAAESLGGGQFSLLWSNGTATLTEVSVRPEYEGDTRRLTPTVNNSAEVPPAPELADTQAMQIRKNEEGSVTRVDLLAGDHLAVTQQTVSEDLFGDTTTETATTTLKDTLPGHVTHFTLDSDGATLYAVTENAFLIRWDLRTPGEPKLLGSIRAYDDGRKVTALAPVLGDVSLAVGDDRGGLVTWSPVRPYPEAKQPQLRANHDLAVHSGPVIHIVPSERSKALLSLDGRGRIFLDYMTSERHLLDLGGPAAMVETALAPRGNGIAGLDKNGEMWVWTIDSEHPEVSWRTLFGKVWYENYDAPAYVWQSSAASDDFEPKLSLVPLVFGSLKGTLYAMLYAIPLALFGAIYISQFAADRVRGIVKPAVEIMAALPSVVIGFLCALWLAPIVESHVVAFLVAPAIMLLIFLVFMAGWQTLRQTEFAKRVERGYEFLVVVPILLLGAYIAYELGPILERTLFDGNFTLWLFHDVGERYDQRNSIIIAFGLGFAVIPIIFTIADDAISSVPHGLKAASLALGATRWQTVWRVVLPAASPGIFAGMMIGFGRAVGETMIVLMATGNTPIMDWSIFNGMRTLSANIAVEIPEAPAGGTLYRVLFLSAVLLFLLTFTVNTVAELVRQSLRKKYGRFQ